MFKKLLIAFLCVFIMTGVALATNYEEVYNNDFIRGSGSPITETINITLTGGGKLLIKNGSLEDDVIELASSTEVYLDGTRILNPFHIEMGMAYLKDLEPGLHMLELTLRGKPGGLVAVTFLEETSPTAERGFEILPDGTVLQKATGLIWHRNPVNPGMGIGHLAVHPDDPRYMIVSTYLENLNTGVYGTDPVDGNAGYTDWRLPTLEELESIIDRRFAFVCLPNIQGEGTVLPPPDNGQFGGMKYGEPFYVCSDRAGNPEPCPVSANAEGYIFITDTPTAWSGYNTTWSNSFYWGAEVAGGCVSHDWTNTGLVWPVRE